MKISDGRSGNDWHKSIVLGEEMGSRGMGGYVMVFMVMNVWRTVLP